MDEYTYDIINWEPINTNSFNLLSKIHIKPDIKLLELFKRAPLNNILCIVTGTNSDYDNNLMYGVIDKSEFDSSYYITLSHIWNSYPNLTNQGKITFLPKSVDPTIDYIENNGSAIIPEKDIVPQPDSNIQTTIMSSNNEKEKDMSTCYNPRMKLSDVLLPIGVSLVLIGMLQYLFPKKFFD